MNGSEEGSYARLTSFVYHSALGLRVIKKKKKKKEKKKKDTSQNRGRVSIPNAKPQSREQEAPSGGVSHAGVLRKKKLVQYFFHIFFLFFIYCGMYEVCAINCDLSGIFVIYCDTCDSASNFLVYI